MKAATRAQVLAQVEANLNEAAAGLSLLLEADGEAPLSYQLAAGSTKAALYHTRAAIRETPTDDPQP